MTLSRHRREARRLARPDRRTAAEDARGTGLGGTGACARLRIRRADRCRCACRNCSARSSDLFVIHNMGRSCPNCTLWADGFNGIYPHIADRAAFVVASPDPPDVQQSFAASRGWRFPMVSHQGSSFAADMGYRSAIGWLAAGRLGVPPQRRPASCASPTPASSQATISARSGTCSTCCPKAPPAGGRNSVTGSSIDECTSEAALSSGACHCKMSLLIMMNVVTIVPRR